VIFPLVPSLLFWIMLCLALSASIHAHANEAPEISSNGGGSTAAISVAENVFVVTAVTATDADVGDTQTFSISGGADAAKFEIDESTGVLRFISAPDFENPLDGDGNNVYEVIVQVTDGELADEQALSVTITNVNETPTNLALSATSIAENVVADSTVGTFNTTDPDASNTFTYALVGGTGSTDNTSFAIIGNALKINGSPNYEAKSSYDIRVLSTDQGGLSAEENFTINVSDVNEAPTDVALSATSIAENEATGSKLATIFGTDSDAGQSATLTFSLLPIGDHASFSVEGNELKTAAVFNYEAKASYSIRLRATDVGAPGLTYDEDFTITVTNVNEAPTDISLSATSIAENQAVGSTLATISGTDPDAGQSATLTFSLVEGTGDDDNASFSILGNALRTVETFDFETRPSYTIRLQATDAGMLVYEEAFTITVSNANDAPTDISLSDSSIAENNAAHAIVGTLSAADADVADSHTFSLVAGTDDADNASFSIDGALLKITPSANYEAKSSYFVRVRATDNGTGALFFDKTFTITIDDANDTPTDIALSATSIAENAADGSTVATISGTDPDADQSATLTFSLLPIGDHARFAVEGNELKTDGVFDFETKASYSIRLRATDAGTPGLTYDEDFTITVADVNEAPVITSNGSGDAASINVAENTTAVATVTASDVDAGQTKTFSITGGADEDKFSINASTGGLLFITAPNYEIPTAAGGGNVYEVTVTVTDNGTPLLADSQDISVSVTDANEAPAITSNGGGATGSANAEENSLDVTTVTADDVDDGGQATFSIIGGDDALRFSIEADTGDLTFSVAPDFEAPTDAGGNNVYEVQVQVTDGTLTDTQLLSVTVTNANDAPVITSNGGGAAGTLNVTENTTLVTTITATDADRPAQTLTYSITAGDDMDLFSINSSTGALTFIAAPDYEVPVDADLDNVYEVAVTVTDNGTMPMSDSQTLSVLVTQANDAPAIASDPTGLIEVAENAVEVTTVVATDEDEPAQALSYAITGGADGSNFDIDSSTGDLIFATAPDFEAPTDSDTNNVYEVIVTVTDDGTAPRTVSQALQITVTDSNEAPSAIALSSSTVAENADLGTTVGTLSATDQDLGQTHAFALVSGLGDADNDSFVIEGNVLKTGEIFDFETKSSYSIRVEVTDDGSPAESFERELTITVGDVVIAVTDPDGRTLEDEVSEAYAFTEPQMIGSLSEARTFTISNPGAGLLDEIEITIDGIQSGSFILDTSATAASLAHGETTTFTVAFSPFYFGERRANIHIANNEDQFDLGVIGTGATLRAALSSGALAVTDTVSRGDNLVIYVSGSDLVLAAQGEILSNAGTGNGTGTVTIPLTSITAGITINIGAAGSSVTLGNMTGYSGALTVAPVGVGDFGIRVTGPVQVGDHAISLTATKAVTISSDLAVTESGTIVVSTKQGITINAGATVSVQDGNLTLSANQSLPLSAGNFTGITLTGACRLTSTGLGNITLLGKAGDTSGRGVAIDGASVVTGGSSGTVRINGTTVGAGSGRYGLYLAGAGTSITSSGANLALTGAAGGSATANYGVFITSGANVVATGTTDIAITGTGGEAGQGVRIRDDVAATTVSVVDGDLVITGHEGLGFASNQGIHYLGGKSGHIESTGSGSITLVTNSVDMTGTSSGAAPTRGIIRTTGTGSLTIKPSTATTSIGIGGGSGTLNLTDAALAYLDDGFTLITIGDTAAGTGDITINTATFNDPVLLAGGTFHDSGGADIAMSAGDTVTFQGTVAPGASPGQLTAVGKIALAANAVVSMEVSGVIAGTQNDQIIASETVDIGSNVALNLVQVGGFIPTGTETFTLIKRTGGTGTFAGKPEGYIFTNLFGSGQAATLTYLAGSSGHDIAVVMGALIPDIKVEQPVGTELFDGLGSITMGKAAVTKRGLTKTFTITNTGTGALTGLALSLTGANAGDFAFTSLATTTLSDGASISFSVTLTPTGLGTRTAVLHIASNVNGTKQPFDITLNGTGLANEVTKPVVTITAPGVSANVNEGAVSVTGTTTDASGIALLETKLGSGAWTEAVLTLNSTGTSASFSVPLSPAPGSNTVSVRATDTSGNVTTATRTFTYVVLRPLTLATAGNGTGTAVLSALVGANAASLQVAKAYTVKATPATGTFFTGWTSPNASIAIANPMTNPLTFTMVDGAQLTATFVSNPFSTAITGTYKGLIKAASGTTPAKTNTGLLTTTVSSTGAFTGSVNLDGISKACNGTFHPGTGNATVSIANGATTWSLALHLDISGSTRRITGTLTQISASVAGDVSDIRADRAAFSSTTTVSLAKRGTFNAAFPARATQSNPLIVYPRGDGFGTVVISSTGGVTVTATLADGTVATHSGSLSKDYEWPVYVSFTTSKGSLSGIATVDETNADSDVSGTDLTWFLDAAVSTYFGSGWPEGIKTDLIAARYTVPVGSAVLPGLGATNASTGNADLTFADGNLAADQIKHVNITTANAVSKAPLTDTTFGFALSKTTGVFNGTFNHTNGNIVSYKGTILQKGTNAGGYGYFLLSPALPGGTGGVRLLPR